MPSAAVTESYNNQTLLLSRANRTIYLRDLLLFGSTVNQIKPNVAQAGQALYCWAMGLALPPAHISQPCTAGARPQDVAPAPGSVLTQQPGHIVYVTPHGSKPCEGSCLLGHTLNSAASQPRACPHCLSSCLEDTELTHGRLWSRVTITVGLTLTQLSTTSCPQPPPLVTVLLPLRNSLAHLY